MFLNLTDTADKLFSFKEHDSDLIQCLSEMRNQGVLTDVCLEVEGQKFLAHKVVLAAASSYFNAMFVSGFQESKSDTVVIEDIDPEVMQILINFIYSGEIKINKMLVHKLLPIATMLQVSKLLEACCLFLENQFSPENVIGIKRFSCEFGHLHLEKKCIDYINQHFIKVSECTEFLHIPLDMLLSILHHDELNVCDERSIFNSIINWITYETSTRKKHLVRLLESMRCHLLFPKFLAVQLSECTLIKEDPEAREYLKLVLEDIVKRSNNGKPRRKPIAPPVLYIVGGVPRKELRSFECTTLYPGSVKECKKLSWKELPSLPTPRTGVGGVILSGCLYVIGGLDTQLGRFGSNSVECYDIRKGRWKRCASMNLARNHPGVSTMDGYIYVVGGLSKDGFHNSAERYDPEEDRWVYMSAMCVPRVNLGTAVVDRFMYAIGGTDGTNSLNSVEVYDPDCNKWMLIESMIIPRSGIAVATVEECIFVVGGYDRGRREGIIEMLDTNTMTWSTLAAMKFPRCNLSVSVIGGKIFAIGGFTEEGYTETTEIYDIETNTWSSGPLLSTFKCDHVSLVSHQITYVDNS